MFSGGGLNREEQCRGEDQIEVEESNMKFWYEADLSIFSGRGKIRGKRKPGRDVFNRSRKYAAKEKEGRTKGSRNQGIRQI